MVFGYLPVWERVSEGRPEYISTRVRSQASAASPTTAAPSQHHLLNLTTAFEPRGIWMHLYHERRESTLQYPFL